MSSKKAINQPQWPRPPHLLPQVLLAMYGAYALVPMLLALNMAVCRVPFPAAKKKKAA